MHFNNIAVLAFTAITGVSGLGINCRGSVLCDNPSFKLTTLLADVQKIDNNRWYQNGEHIACWENVAGGGLCAFLQGTGGIPGSLIKTLLQDLVNHNCHACGSIPVFFPSDNNIASHGELTVNAVHSTGGCNGLC